MGFFNISHFGIKTELKGKSDVLYTLNLYH